VIAGGWVGNARRAIRAPSTKARCADRFNSSNMFHVIGVEAEIVYSSA
jgi:hypothetical protein